MTIAEALEVFNSFMQSGYTALGIYLTALSGYLVVAYLVGDRLTRFQLYTISFLFLCFSVLLISGSWAFFNGGMDVIMSPPGQETRLSIRLLAFGVHALAVLEVIGIGLAIKFMLNARSQPRGGRAPTPGDGA